VQAARIAQRRGEEIELLPRRLGGLGGQGHGHDWVFRPEVLQMGLEKAKQNLHRVGRIGNLKLVRVTGFIRKGELEGKLAGHEVEGAEAPA